MNYTPREPLRSVFSNELIVVIASVGLAIMSMSLLQPVLPLYLTSIGISPTVIGLMLAAGMAGMVLGESTGGWLADRAGIRLPMLIGTFLCAPMVFSMVFARGTALMFVIFFCWGVVRSAVFGPGRGYIGTNVPFSHKATFMAIYATAMAASRGLGSFAGGFIYDCIGHEWTFFTASAIAVAAGVLVVTGLKRSTSRPKPPNLSAAPSPEPPASTTPAKGYRLFVYQCLIAAMYFSAIGVSPFVSLLAVQVAGLSASQVGILFTINSIVNAVMLIPMGRLADRKSKKAMMTIGLLVTASGQALIAFSTSFPMLAAGGIVQSTGGALFGPAAVALLSENVPLRRQSTAMGIYGGCEDVGFIIGSALGGVVWSALGPQSTFILVGTTPALLGAVICSFLLRGRPGGGPNPVSPS